MVARGCERADPVIKRFGLGLQIGAIADDLRETNEP